MNIQLNKQVFNKSKFKETVSVDFTQLDPSPTPTIFDLNLASLNDFFILYNKFFYDIPKEGEVNSHAFLIKESSNYVGFKTNNDEIEALLDEIAQLREENLTLKQENISLLVPDTTNTRDNSSQPLNINVVDITTFNQ